MTDKKEKTTPSASIGVDAEQSSQNVTTSIITDDTEDFKDFEEFQREMRRDMDPSYLKTITMKELYDSIYHSKPPLIDGLLYPGTYIFAGAPKLGKSFLMAQFAYHVSTGTPIWGYETKKGTVLYLALEDDYRRLQERMYRMFGAESVENLHFSVTAGKVGSGLDDQLQRFINEHPDTKLIIIDTLQKVREGAGDNYSYANDYEIITKLKKFTDRYGICVLIVHHTRKQNADDKFDMISGTTGLLGSADGGFVLRKEKRTSNNAILEVAGRDQPDQKLYLIRNTESLLWELERTENELWKEPPEPILETIAEFINESNTEWSGSPTELVEVLKVDMKANTLSMKLNVNAGRLLNDYSIHYENKRCHDGRKISLYLEKA